MFATYTNTKASMATEEADGKTRFWRNNCGADIKAWFASVISWCICKSLTFEQFGPPTLTLRESRNGSPGSY
jgi:hypothetical protein